MEKSSLLESTHFEDSHWDILGDLCDAIEIDPLEGGSIEASNEPMPTRSAACITSPPQTVSCVEKNVISDGKPQQRRRPASTKESSDKDKPKQLNTSNTMEFGDFVGMLSTEEHPHNIKKGENFVDPFAKSLTSISMQIEKDKQVKEKNGEFSSGSEGSEMSDIDYSFDQSQLNSDISANITPSLMSLPSKANSVDQVGHVKDKAQKAPVKVHKNEHFSPSVGTYPIIPESKEGIRHSDIDDAKKGDAFSPAFSEGNYFPQKFDSLPELKRGTPFLKFSKQGFPHFRQFNISQKNDELIWFSNKKKLEQSSIRIKDINEILVGQQTKEFRRMSWTTLTPASFTIWHSGRKRSLNLVAKSVDEMKMWVEALRRLQEKAVTGEDLSKLRSLEVSVDFRDRNRPQSRRHSGNFVRSNETKEKTVNPSIQKRLVGDLKAISKLFQDVKELAQNEAVQKSHEETSIKQILSELEERIDELNDEIVNTRNTKIAENDVWRTRVDLKSLKEKILVIIRESNRKSKRRFSVF